MRQAIVLVGGRGTRLGDHTRDTPKPLLAMAGDVRFLDMLIENIARHGVREILLLAGHFGDQVATRYRGSRVLGAELDVIVEPIPAGTGGALRHVAERLDEVFLMANGDSIFDINYLALAADLRPSDGARLALRSVPDGRRFGRVTLCGDRIQSFHEKDPNWGGGTLISGGVYVMRRSVLDLVDKLPCSIETDIFPQMCARGQLSGAEFGGFFLDIGLPETLAEARAILPAQMRRAAILFDRDGTLTADDGYTFRPEALRLLPGAAEAVRACNDSGALAIVITNQAGIAHGKFTRADMELFHARLQTELARHGAHIDAVYHCPFHDSGVVEAYQRPDHPDRKPNSGLVRRALLEWRIDPARAFMVGDKAHDVEAARGAGVAGAIVQSGELHFTVARAISSFSKIKAPSPPPNPIAALKDRAQQAKAWLFEHALPLWWGKGFDRNTQCFHERLTPDGEPMPGPRRIRVQARQTFVYAAAGKLGWSGPWREAVEAGAKVLVERGFHADGGTIFALDVRGQPSDLRHDLYDAAFVIFALAHAGSMLARPDLIAKGEELLRWVLARWRHPQGGFLEGDITPISPRRQNPHMHMLEAMLALFEASEDSVHLKEASAIVQLCEERFVDAEYGGLVEYFTEDWRPMPDEQGRITEPGHQFEWSWLLDRYSRLTHTRLSPIAKNIYVHGEIYGVDPATGVTADDVWVEGGVRTPTSRLWPHTERIKANLARFERASELDAAARTVQAFDVLMTYCDTPIKGLWRDTRLADGAFAQGPAPASSFYHITTAMVELARVSALV
jgi:D-glycero-D-manno-heptose 1,7-bisphosphate phosphatase